jgi:hypothetical protein
MFGSMLSGLLASVTMVSTTVALMLPFYVAAGLSGLVWLAAYRFLPDSASRLGIKKESQRNAQSLLLVLSLLVMLGLGSFEVGMALLGQQVLSLQPREIGWMFIECSLVMILVQVFLLTDSAGRQQLIGTSPDGNGGWDSVVALRDKFANDDDGHRVDCRSFRLADYGAYLSDISRGRFGFRSCTRQTDCRW